MSKRVVYLIVNGSLGMSPGKVAAQCFQACQRLFDGDHSPAEELALREWRQHGTKTVVKVARTQHLFERAIRELDGALMIDEGMNEVEPDSPTVFATYPILREQGSGILKHKNVPIYCG